MDSTCDMMQPMRIYTRLADTVRFWRNVEFRPGDCWSWKGHVSDKGYGRFGTWNPPPGVKRLRYAHRFAYEDSIGPIPEGLTIDHLCRTRDCVNPLHMEPATFVDNAMAGNCVGVLNRMKTHCPKGHEYTPENTKRVPSNPGSRYCKACHREEGNKKGGIASANRTHCPAGHEYSAENTWTRPSRPNGRECRLCRRRLKAAEYQRTRKRRGQHGQ